LTATKVPLQVAQTLPFASSVASITARSSPSSTARARSLSTASLGVGRLSTTWKSAVTVQGGAFEPDRRISAEVAVQLLWQSSNAPMIPPFTTPGNASWCFFTRYSATHSSPWSKLFSCSPCAFAGPHPKQVVFGP